ncbi:MAG: hypothetical protein CMJ31_08655 [Phycisphaerae bacterium]|nr:hypothetical protein [Phycisphaerae bacterium]
MVIASGSALGGAEFFVAPDGVNFQWERGVSALSAYAEWNIFTSPFGDNDPDVGEFVGGVFDENAGDWDVSDASGGSFITGTGNIYSFGSVQDITVLVPSFGLGDGYETTVVLQTRVQGVTLDNSTVELDGEAYQAIEEAEPIDLGEPGVGGGGVIQDSRYVWTVPGSATGYEIRFMAIDTSLSLDRVIVDTYTVESNDGCNAADLAEPFETLDIADVVGFLQFFGAGDASADLAAPMGTLDIADVVAFLQIFGGGCPS